MRISSIVIVSTALLMVLTVASVSRALPFQWVTGEDFVYENWAPPEPNLPGPGCINFHALNSSSPAPTWNDLQCDFGDGISIGLIFGYVAELGLGESYTAVNAPSGITWTDANAAALAIGPDWHIATITSPEENALVFALIDDASFWDFNPGGSANSNGPWLGGFSLIPEPSTALLLSLGLVGMAAVRRRRAL